MCRYAESSGQSLARMRVLACLLVSIVCALRSCWVGLPASMVRYAFMSEQNSMHTLAAWP